MNTKPIPKLSDARQAIFWAHVEKTDACWKWSGATNGGYGTFRVGAPNTMRLAHRIAYELLIGPISEGLTLDHLCRNPACVRPEHLEAVTHRENVLRGNTVSGLASRRTHCPQGHPYDEANTWRSNNGRHRQCRACWRERDRIKRLNAKEKVA